MAASELKTADVSATELTPEAVAECVREALHFLNAFDHMAYLHLAATLTRTIHFELERAAEQSSKA
jgi:hypothetical protein